MKTIVVTCTEGRPKLLALCRQWVEHNRPDVWHINNPRNDEWTIAAQGIPTVRTFHAGDGEGVRRALTALAKTLLDIAGNPTGDAQDLIVVMEDDDWYPSSYCETFKLIAQNHHEATTFCALEDVRYNLPARRFMRVNCYDQPPSAGAIAMRRGVAAEFAQRLMAECEFDPIGADHRAFDQMARSSGYVARIAIDCRRVSIKGLGYGLPGTPGATSKHDPNSEKVLGWAPDSDQYHFLRALIGYDADDYIKLLQC